MWVYLVIILVVIILIFFEYRIRKPDQIVLFESAGKVKQRRARIYPRHLSMAISATTHSIISKIEAEAKGKLPINVRLAITVMASIENLSALVRVGGWKVNAVETAAKELEVLVHSLVKEFSEQYEIEDITAEKMSQYLDKKLGRNVEILGLEIISLNVQLIEPVDEEIAAAMQRRETTRILEQTEEENQRTRAATIKAKLDADEKIAFAEHELELKKYKLKNVEQEKEAELAMQRTQEELQRRDLQFNFERKEIDLLKSNPQLMVLSPQLTRLAEAAQNLRNARTVVSLSANEIHQGNQILNMLQNFLQNMLQNSDEKSAKTTNSPKK